MDEYIKRKAALEECDWYANEFCECEYAIMPLKGALENIPAADVRPVVFCKDCKLYGGRPWENNESGICARTDVGVGEFDFCSYGEKKEER